MGNARNQKFTGDKMQHETLGLVRVKRPVAGSFTKVKIEVIDRGPGWNPETESYTGVKKSHTENGEKSFSWMRGQNYQFGDVDNVHVNTLKAID